MIASTLRSRVRAFEYGFFLSKFSDCLSIQHVCNALEIEFDFRSLLSLFLLLMQDSHVNQLHFCMRNINIKTYLTIYKSKNF